jgi:hypothetical protein
VVCRARNALGRETEVVGREREVLVKKRTSCREKLGV